MREAIVNEGSLRVLHWPILAEKIKQREAVALSRFPQERLESFGAVDGVEAFEVQFFQRGFERIGCVLEIRRARTDPGLSNGSGSGRNKRLLAVCLEFH